MSIYEFIKNKYNTLRYPIIDERQFDDVVNEIRTESAERIKELEEQLHELAERECVLCRKKIKELEAQCIKYQAELMNNDPALTPTTEDSLDVVKEK